MDERFCAAAGRRITPDECGSFDGCHRDCDLRKEYGWVGKAKPDPSPAADTPEAKEKTRQCNMCKRDLDIVSFRLRRDHKDCKKTCAECEDKYVTKTAPKKGYAGQKERSGKKTQAAKTAPNPPQKTPPAKKEIDPSEVSWVKNTFRRTGSPSVSIGRRGITFNADARRQFKQLFRKSQTVDVGLKQNGNDGLQILFRFREDMTGHYRLQSGGEKKEQIKICVSLDVKGYKVSRGPWPVREIDGMLLAEIAR